MDPNTEETILLTELNASSNPPVVEQPIDYMSYTVTLLRSTLAVIVLASLILLRKTVSDFVVRMITAATPNLDEKSRNNITHTIAGPISYSCILAGVYISGIIFDLPDCLQEAFDNVVQSLSNIFVFWILYTLITPLSHVVQTTSSHSFGDEMRKVVSDLLKIFVLVIGFLSVLQAWGIDVSNFMAGLGLVSLAVSLAAADTFRNLFGSLVLFADGALKEKEWITTPEVDGVIEKIGIRTTTIRNFDTSTVIVPNGNLASSTINLRKLRRINWSLPIAGGNSKSLKSVVSRLKNFILENPKVQHDMTTIIVLDEFGENCVKLFCYFFVVGGLDWAGFMQVKQDIILAFKRIVAEEGLQFGVPTRLVLLHKQ
jgi:MscS family membrane protein